MNSNPQTDNGKYDLFIRRAGNGWIVERKQVAALFIIASRSHSNIPHDAEIRAKSHAEAWYHDFVYTRQIAKRALRIIGEIKE